MTDAPTDNGWRQRLAEYPAYANVWLGIALIAVTAVGFAIGTVGPETLTLGTIIAGIFAIVCGAWIEWADLATR